MEPLVQLGLVVGAYFVGRVVYTMVRGRAAVDPKAAETYAGLRDMVFSRKASDVNETPVNGVFGVVMELAIGGGVATLVGLADGNASLYLSTGGGVLGGAGHEAVRKAARQLCEVAAGDLARFTTTGEFPTPERGHVRFYVTSEAGVLTVDSEEKAVRGGEHSLHSLYAAGQELLTAVRISSQEPSSA